MRLVLRHLILAPFAVCIALCYPLVKALDYAMYEDVIPAFREYMGELYRRRP